MLEMDNLHFFSGKTLILSCHLVVIAFFIYLYNPASGIFSLSVSSICGKRRFEEARISPHTVHIMTFDSRPVLDENFDLPSISAAANYYYANKLGASFAAYFAPAADPQDPRSSAGCLNSLFGVRRSPSWCKLLAVWHAMQQQPQCEYFVFIDSDAVFRRVNVSVISRHVEFLTNKSGNAVIGFLWNPPTPHLPSAGYFFLRRCKNVFRFLAHWYNYDDPAFDLNFPWEQNALQNLVRNNSWIENSMIILNELQYTLPTIKETFGEEQVLFHGAMAKWPKLILAESAFGFDNEIFFSGAFPHTVPDNLTNLFGLERSVPIVYVDMELIERDLQDWFASEN